ncbi:transketolase [Halobacteroides halobius DSM 5150]|uniref:Transketolase n=1 Tax=Halobacteroides halobius (strain ATCC 35273 / DSM 5150 / MD-1) TaxID=748449 RepID=L0K899_HALHC|nr:transketolase [Halobacteroides halobius]AGB41507.1 transketolase [Halobacteroides halobius DSM 5150]
MLKEVSNVVRGLSADMVEEAGSGHPGLPVGCADIGSLLYSEVMSHDPTQPEWANRDRFVLSAGHGSALLYSLLHITGYNLSLDDLKNFRQLNSKTPGHPEYGHTPGIDTTTGPLGQGFSNAVGMAVTEKMLAEKYNTTDHQIVDHHTYTLLGDGCMMEGIVAEAASLAGHLGLDKLVAIYDDNDISIGGNTDITFTESVADRFKAYDWHVVEDVDGHDLDALRAAIAEGKEVIDKPTLIMANTHIAYGAPTKQDTSSAHGSPLGEDEIKGLKEEFGLPTDEKFYISNKVKEFLNQRKEELQAERAAWEEEFAAWAKANPELKEEWDNGYNLELPTDLQDVVEKLEIDTPIATRKASGATLREMADQVPYLVGGSADLAPSNKTYLNKYDEIQQDNYDGRNFRFGVREHAMGAIANGISLHQGLRPFVATFLVFSDYLRPAVRMSALMNQPVVYVFTHDSVYIGEDGPTHQPVEQIESLRLIPNLDVIRPADEEETKEAWLQAMERTDGPTALILTRQDLPHLNKDNKVVNMSQGGYVVKEERNAEVTLLASGSEVSLATEVAEMLTAEDVLSRIVSIPNRDKFLEQEQSYIQEVLGDEDNLRVAIEAGVGNGWHQLLKLDDLVVSVDQFGASGPGQEVAQQLGFTTQKITEDILNQL